MKNYSFRLCQERLRRTLAGLLSVFSLHSEFYIQNSHSFLLTSFSVLLHSPLISLFPFAFCLLSFAFILFPSSLLTDLLTHLLTLLTSLHFALRSSLFALCSRLFIRPFSSSIFQGERNTILPVSLPIQKQQLRYRHLFHAYRL